MTNADKIYLSVPPGESSVLWKGAKSNRYYNTKKKALCDNAPDFYTVKNNFNIRAALAAFAVLLIIYILIKN